MAISLAPLVAIFALWWIGAAVFAVVKPTRGRATERLARMGGTPLLSSWFMEYGYWVISLPARAFVRAGVAPNTITLLGLATMIAGGVTIARGHFGLGGWAFCAGSALDAMDGIVARERRMSSRAGELLDAVVDRYGDAVVFAGLVFYYRGSPWALALVLCAMLGTSMVSYVRARAATIGVDPPSGLMRRHERAIYLGVGTAMAPVVAHFVEPGAPRPAYHLALAATALVALLANWSALRQLAFGMRALREREKGPP